MRRPFPLALAAILLVALAGCPRPAPESANAVAPEPVAKTPAASGSTTAAGTEPGGAAAVTAATAEPAGTATPTAEQPQAAPADPAPNVASGAAPGKLAAEAPRAPRADKPATKPAEARPQTAAKPKPQLGKWPIPEGPLNDDKYVAISAKYAAAVMVTPEKDRTEEASRALLREVLKEADVSFDEYKEYTIRVAEDAERTEKVGKWIVQAMADHGIVNLSKSAGVPGQDLKLRGVVEDDKKGG